MENEQQREKFLSTEEIERVKALIKAISPGPRALPPVEDQIVLPEEAPAEVFSEEENLGSVAQPFPESDSHFPPAPSPETPLPPPTGSPIESALGENEFPPVADSFNPKPVETPITDTPGYVAAPKTVEGPDDIPSPFRPADDSTPLVDIPPADSPSPFRPADDSTPPVDTPPADSPSPFRPADDSTPPVDIPTPVSFKEGSESDSERMQADSSIFAPVSPPGPSESPSDPVNDASEYQPAYEMPAYQPSIGDEAVTVSPGDIPEAEDVLYMIAQVDPELEKAAAGNQVMGKIRQQADPISNKKGKGRPKLNPLPFDMLSPGVPLVATVYSPSGGVGKSSTAMNLAAYIAAVGQAMANKESKSGKGARAPRVLVLDGDIVQGSLAIRITGELEPSIHGLQMYIDKRESEGFGGEMAWPQYYSSDEAPPLQNGEKTMLDFVHWHKSLPNLNLLAAPERPDLFWDFGPEEYRFILKMLAKFYDVIIIDTGTDLVLDSQRAWLSHANEVFLVTAPENDRLYNASKAVDYIIHEQPHPQDHTENPRILAPLVTPDKLSVIMTRYDMESGIDSVKIIDEIFPWLDQSQKFFVPNFAKEMVIANNFGDFLALENAKYAQSVDELAQRIFQRYVDAKTNRGIPSSV